MIYEKYQEKRTDFPDQNIISSLKERLIREENIYNGSNKENDFRRLWQIYFYLFYGLYTRAWKEINLLKDEQRWKIPGDVYHFLKNLETV